VSPERTNTTIAKDKHTIQAANILSLYSMSPSMNITGGIYRWCYASRVQLPFYALATVTSLEYS